ncbi:MAG: ComEA family DNA-binding protein [Thermotogota bacterium]
MKIKLIFVLIFIIIVFSLGFLMNNKSSEDSDYKIKKIDLLTSDLYDLIKIPGIGRSKAQNILDYRKKYSFSKIEDIMKVSGIGKATYEKIKNYIFISQKTIIIKNNKMNINQASKEELVLLPGIGDVSAERIIDYRKIQKIKDYNDLIKIGLNKNVLTNLEGLIEF